MNFLDEQDEVSFRLHHLNDDTYLQFVKENIRPNGRTLNEYRPAQVETYANNNNGIIGSGIASIGNTKVICVITTMIGTLSNNNKNIGDVDIDVQLGSVCSQIYDNTKAKPDLAYTIEQVLDELICKGSVIDLSQLVIVENVYAFRLCVSITIVSMDGNLLDTVILACMHALNSTNVPLAVDTGDKSQKDNKVLKEFGISTKLSNPLLLHTKLVPVTCGVYGPSNYCIFDLDKQEEDIIQNTVTVVFDANDNIVFMSNVSVIITQFHVYLLTNFIFINFYRSILVEVSR